MKKQALLPLIPAAIAAGKIGLGALSAYGIYSGGKTVAEGAGDVFSGDVSKGAKKMLGGGLEAGMNAAFLGGGSLIGGAGKVIGGAGKVLGSGKLVGAAGKIGTLGGTTIGSIGGTVGAMAAQSALAEPPENAAMPPEIYTPIPPEFPKAAGVLGSALGLGLGALMAHGIYSGGKEISGGVQKMLSGDVSRGGKQALGGALEAGMNAAFLGGGGGLLGRLGSKLARPGSLASKALGLGGFVGDIGLMSTAEKLKQQAKTRKPKPVASNIVNVAAPYVDDVALAALRRLNDKGQILRRV